MRLEILREFRAEVEYPRSAMAEWLILLLLVPAIVVPVVMLVGFAGCQVLFPVDDPPNGEDVATTGPLSSETQSSIRRSARASVLLL